MTDEKAREDFMNDVYNTLDFLPTNNEANRIIDSFDRVTSGLEQQPCEDAVSRQAVIEQTYNWSKDEFLRITNPFDYLRKRINSLPSVTPKEKTAAWVPIDEEPHDIYECNACGWLLYYEDTTDFKYCPNCGARMVSE